MIFWKLRERPFRWCVKIKVYFEPGFFDKIPWAKSLACSKFRIWAYHLKELLPSFQKIRKSLNLDHQNSNYRANSSTFKMIGIVIYTLRRYCEKTDHCSYRDTTAPSGEIGRNGDRGPGHNHFIFAYFSLIAYNVLHFSLTHSTKLNGPTESTAHWVVTTGTHLPCDSPVSTDVQALQWLTIMQRPP